MEKLAGKVCLVTGGGSGIGLAVARGLLAEGARVAIAGRDESKLGHAAKRVAGGERLTLCTLDVANPDQVQAGVEQLRDRWGPVDMLVNNAGLNFRERSVRELTPESWQLLLRANLDGAFYCIHAVLPSMLQRHDG